MAEIIPIHLKRAAIALAATLDCTRAAELLGTSEGELLRQVHELEAILCVHLFDPAFKNVRLTDEGRYLIDSFQQVIEGTGDQEQKR